MRRLRQKTRWCGLFALIPLMVLLMVLDVDAPLTDAWQRVLLAGIAVLICVLALRWVQSHPELVEPLE